jgi:hypothetical protein
MDKIDTAIYKINEVIERLSKVKECSIPGVVVMVDTKIQAYNHCIDILKELKEE